MVVFDNVIKGFDKSVLRVGNRLSLTNEAATHIYLSPVSIICFHLVVNQQLFDAVVDLFEARIVNHPEVTLEGQIGRRGSCEYTYVFCNAAMLLLVELKFDISSMSDDRRSDIIGQICAEADGVSSSFQHLILRGIYVQCHKKSGSCTCAGYFDGWSRMGIFLF